jgi:cytidine deaminase
MQEIVRHAAEARLNAYAPYSGYLVGACVLAANGRLYAACNVENVSYGLTLCAERLAVGRMVAAGCQELLEIAIVTRDGGTPCGACLQTLAEFAIDRQHVPVHCVNDACEGVTFTLSELLPHGFASAEVRQNRPRPEESE